LIKGSDLPKFLAYIIVHSIQKERDAMEKMWKAREKQLDKVLLNAIHIKGSIERIAGSDVIRLELRDEDEEGLLLE